MNSLPSRQHCLLYLRLASLLLIQFVVIYGGTNLLTRHRDDVHRIYFEWELAIPMLPAMVWVYASIIPLMLLPLFYIDSRQLKSLARQMALAMLIAGAVFLLYPGQIGYAPIADLSTGIRLIRQIDLPYNVLPSLHVALSAIIMSHLYRVFELPGRLFLAAWLLALIASVVLTHQHHLADVLGAAILVWLCQQLLPQDIS